MRLNAPSLKRPSRDMKMHLDEVQARVAVHVQSRGIGRSDPANAEYANLAFVSRRVHEFSPRCRYLNA